MCRTYGNGSASLNSIVSIGIFSLLLIVPEYNMHILSDIYNCRLGTKTKKYSKQNTPMNCNVLRFRIHAMNSETEQIFLCHKIYSLY